ncbi:MAG: hypothetical protein VX466_04420 [Myxococcota bacterium]|nr:hypothetical protein [Myxococcota bacterium]
MNFALLDRIASGLLTVSLLLAASAGIASAGDREEVLAMRLADLEVQGRCGEALALYRESGSQHPRLALVAGRCQVRASEYASAVATLEPLRDNPEAPADVDLQLGVAQYHLGDLDAARDSIERARARGSEGAILELYTGLLQLQQDEARAAALSLERARRADAQAVEPVASYYAFVAWRSLAERARATAALARLREIDPDGPWIAEAERILSLARRRSARPPVWANTEVGFEHDGNVSVKGESPAVFINGDLVDRKKDARGIWSLDGGVELFRDEGWAGGLVGSYTGTAHFHINEFDTHYPTVSAWVDHELSDRTSLRGSYDYSYAWVNYDPYVSAHSTTATLFHLSDTADALTALSLGADWYDFRYDLLDPPQFATTPPGETDPDRGDIDRDGTELSLDWTHYMQTDFEDLELRCGYRYTWYSADGQEFDHRSHRFLSGFGVTLPGEIAWDGWVSFTYRAYDETSVYDGQADPNSPNQGPLHRDRLWEASTSFEKSVTEKISLLARYYFADSGSNVEVYDYDRHVVGFYVRYKLR